MYTSDYLREAYRQLSDTNFYQKVKTDTTVDIQHKLNVVAMHCPQKHMFHIILHIVLLELLDF